MHLAVAVMSLMAGAANAGVAWAAADSWHVLQPQYADTTSAVDGFTFEWEYFMVHDRNFTGSIGYVLADPKGRFGGRGAGAVVKDRARYLPFSVMPSGTSLAVGGMWSDGSVIADYEWLNARHVVGPKGKSFAGYADNQTTFGTLTEVEPVTARGGVFQLRGRSRTAAWDLMVTPDWGGIGSDQEGQPFGPVTGTDMGYLPGEVWTVHMQWPRTRVRGTMRNLATGETVAIDGHGYRENSWGKWNFALDGWFFAVVSDAASQVEWAWQSYHRSEDMDWLDVSFIDRGERQTRRFFAKNNALTWRVGGWRFDDKARLCVPSSVTVQAQDGDYRINAAYDLQGRQFPMVSDATPLTKIFVIMIHTPRITGTIENAKTGALVASFSGQGGGEFAATRSLSGKRSAEDCAAWGESFESKYAPARGLAPAP